MSKYIVRWICIFIITIVILCWNKVIPNTVFADEIINETSTITLDVKKKTEQIKWYKSFKAGLKRSEKAQKPLLVDFEANWCGWCKKLDTTTYQDSQVIALSKKFICVKVNCEIDSATARRYGVRGLPTIIFMNTKGEVIHQVVGYRGAEDFVSEMQKALAKYSQ